VEHEHARAEPDQVSVRLAESQPPLPAGAERLLRLQRQAGNRAVGGMLRRESRHALARAETTAPPGLASPAFTIPMETETLDIIPIFNGYKAEIRDWQETFVGYEGNCADAAMETFKKLTNKALYKLPGKQSGLRTYDRADPKSGRSGAIGWRQTDLNWNTDKVRETLDYIKLKIDQGLPLYIGVNEGDTEQKIGQSGRPINDAVTDHFLVIVGYTAVNTEPGLWPMAGGGWRIVRLQAIDNATYDEVRRFPEFDVTRYSIRKPAWHTIGRDAADREYQISQVRVYAEDVERMKDAKAWWN
jgi:hypothetical protein